MSKFYLDPRVANPENEAKLPLWGQELVASLRRQLENAERQAQVALLATNPDDSNTVLDLDRISGEPVGLGNYAHVSYRLGPNNIIHVRINRDSDDVVVSADWGRLVIYPQVANVVRITGAQI